MNCINTSSEEFKKLVEKTNISPIELEMEIARWQKSKDTNRFPTSDELLNSIKVLDTMYSSNMVFFKNYNFEGEPTIHKVVDLSDMGNIKGLRKYNESFVIDPTIYGIPKGKSINARTNLIISQGKVFIKKGNNSAFGEFYSYLDYKNPIRIKGRTYYYLTDKYIFDTPENVHRKEQEENFKKVQYARAAGQGRYGIKPSKRANLSPRLKTEFTEYIKQLKEHENNTLEIKAGIKDFGKYVDSLKTDPEDYKNPIVRQHALDNLIDQITLHSPTQITQFKNFLNNLPTVVLINMNLNFYNAEIDVNVDEEGFADIHIGKELPESEYINLNKYGNRIGFINRTYKPSLGTNARMPEDNIYKPYIEKVNQKIFNNTFEKRLTNEEISILQSKYKIKVPSGLRSKGIAVLLEIDKERPILARKFKNEYKFKSDRQSENVLKKLKENFDKNDETQIYNVNSLIKKHNAVNSLYGLYLDMINHTQIFDKQFQINIPTESPYEDLEFQPKMLIRNTAKFVYDMNAFNPLLKQTNKIIEELYSEWNLSQVSEKQRFQDIYEAVITGEGPIADKLKSTIKGTWLTNLINRLVDFIFGRNKNTAMDIMEDIINNLHETMVATDTMSIYKQGRFTDFNILKQNIENLQVQDNIGLIFQQGNDLINMINAEEPISKINNLLKLGFDAHLEDFQTLPEGLNFKNQSIVYLNSLKEFPQDIYFGLGDEHELPFGNGKIVYLKSLNKADIPYRILNKLTGWDVRTKDWQDPSIQGIETFTKTESQLLTGVKSKYGFSHMATYYPLRTEAFHYTLGLPGKPVTVEFNAGTDKFPNAYYKAQNYHGVKGDKPLGWLGGVIGDTKKINKVNPKDFYYNGKHYEETSRKEGNHWVRIFTIDGRDTGLIPYNNALETLKKDIEKNIKSIKTFSITEVQSDSQQRTHELKEGISLRGVDLKPFQQYKSQIGNEFDGWYYVFAGTGIFTVLKNNPDIEEIRIPTSAYYRTKHSLAPVEIYDKIGSVFKHTMSEDGNWYVISVKNLTGVAPANMKDQYDVIVKAAIAKGLKDQKDITPDLGSDRELAQDVLNEIVKTDFFRKYFNSELGIDHLHELDSYIDKKYSDKKPDQMGIDSNQEGGEKELVGPDGEIINDENNEEDSELQNLINNANKKDNIKLDIDDLLDQLNEAITKRDTKKANYIKQVLDDYFPKPKEDWKNEDNSCGI